uniref:Uncharacterized protein n=1 Tax=Arundo donax TaxID=35708 RepID=A0A0A8XUP4_ARUDO
MKWRNRVDIILEGDWLLKVSKMIMGLQI